ncbi:hypothetical protein BM536_000125 [Streptomyces phaeoluteigriseus]|uniref:Uncharacterized protein n=1 Tax=Streptomyces phaeoluteigriseus TaxID=114686 RepID=A0A1V6MZR6_9ACTN|nr:hypothetical protein BM536_000125 [Streptomyces phaeoluteigriseus]
MWKAVIPGRGTVTALGRGRALGVFLLLFAQEVGACGIQSVQHGLEGVPDLVRDVRICGGSPLRVGVVVTHRFLLSLSCS